MAVYDVNPEKLIHKVAEELQKEDLVQPPEWAIFVKTGMHKERQPTQDNWWYIRAASILRKIYKNGPIGVSKLRVVYGGKKNRGVRPEKFFPASGNILRKILQQLEKAGLAKQAEKGAHKGRIVTGKGHAILENSATAIMKEEGVVIQAKPKVEAKPKKTVKKKAAKKTVKKVAKKAEPEKKVEEKPAEKKTEEKKTEEKPAEKKAEEKPVEKAPEKTDIPKPEEKDGKQ